MFSKCEGFYLREKVWESVMVQEDSFERDHIHVTFEYRMLLYSNHSILLVATNFLLCLQ